MNSIANLVPPSYEESERLHNQQQGLVDSEARSILSGLSDSTPAMKKLIMERAIKILNQQPNQAGHQIYLSTDSALQVNPGGATCPGLNRWVEERLSDLGQQDLGGLAFSTGHWNDFIKVSDECPTDVRIQVSKFFQYYFACEGTDPGVQKLWGLVESDIFSGTVKHYLESALDHMSEFNVENLPAKHSFFQNNEFNYRVMYEQVVLKIGRDNGKLARRLNITDESLEQIKGKYARNLQHQVCASLQAYVDMNPSLTGVEIHTKLINALSTIGHKLAAGNTQKALLQPLR